ncbi:MAG: molybdenum cofactor biosynthesis protein MoaE [Candidatus Kariarchaeaceae archaeon]|jgi:molybdopterin synthase catalytic subunit
MVSNKQYAGWIASVGSINLQDVINDLNISDECGAITTFTGIVRELSDISEKRVLALEVEAWTERGTSSMEHIAMEIGAKFNLLGIRIVHLEGKIELGKPIVFVVISSIHRKEAFAALEEAILAYKQKSPVWKKEIYDDGTGNWITTAKQ